MLANDHYASHGRAGANTNSRHDAHIRHSLVLDNWNKRHFNFSAREQISATGGGRIRDQFHGVLPASLLKAPDERRRVQIARGGHPWSMLRTPALSIRCVSQVLLCS